MSERWGLVLAGGGARGSYQIGAWQALAELGLTDRISVVSGTSIGALNAALFLEGDLKRGVDLWRAISPELLLAEHSKWKCSRRRMRALLEEQVNREAISASPIAFFATCLTGFPVGAPTYFMLNGCSTERIDQILCASAAVPFFFKPVEIDGVPYSDGGIGLGRDNVPVRPVYEAGCDTIVVVHLSPWQVVDPRRYPGARLIQVVPSTGLGFGLNGQLDFDHGHAQRRIDQGYWDALAQLTTAILTPPEVEGIRKVSVA